VASNEATLSEKDRNNPPLAELAEPFLVREISR
jgi:hypothetical protein